MRIATTALSLLLAGVLSASPASAQTPDEPASAQQAPPPKPPAPKPQPKPVIPRAKPKPGVGVFGIYDSEWMAAKDTFDAVFDKSSFTSAGLGGEVFNLFRGLFVRAAFSKTTQNGSRVAVVDGDALQLNIPLELKLTTTEIGAGWRVPLGRPRRPAAGPAARSVSRFSAYGGGGLLFVSYRETSDFAELEDNSRESFKGYSVFGGVDATVWKVIFAGAEAQFRMVPDALGEGGASREFNESDLGGLVVRVMFGIRK